LSDRIGNSIYKLWIENVKVLPNGNTF
jgi:hypothetical protein